MNRVTPELTDMRHIKLCYSKDRYCGHPHQSGIFNYGNGEIAVLHSHASSRYEVRDDIDHSFTTGYARPCKDSTPAVSRWRRDLAERTRRGGVG